MQIFEEEDPSDFGAEAPILKEILLNKPRPILYIRLSDDPYKDFR